MYSDPATKITNFDESILLLLLYPDETLSPSQINKSSADIDEYYSNTAFSLTKPLTDYYILYSERY